MMYTYLTEEQALLERLGVKISSTDTWVSNIIDTLEKHCASYTNNLLPEELSLFLNDHRVLRSTFKVIEPIDWIKTLQIKANIILINTLDSEFATNTLVNKLYIRGFYLSSGVFNSQSSIINDNIYQFCDISLNLIYAVDKQCIYYKGSFFYKATLIHELMHAYDTLIDYQYNRVKKINTSAFNSAIFKLSNVNYNISNILVFLNDYEQHSIINQEYTIFVEHCNKHVLNICDDIEFKEDTLKEIITDYILYSKNEQLSKLRVLLNCIQYLNTDNGKLMTTRYLYMYRDVLSDVLNRNINLHNKHRISEFVIKKLETFKKKLVKTLFMYYDLIQNYNTIYKDDILLHETGDEIMLREELIGRGLIKNPFNYYE